MGILTSKPVLSNFCSPDRGLVTGGQYNLSLFVKLFWLVVTTFLAVILIVWPISFLLRGIYIIPKGTKARACLLEEQRYMGAFKQTNLDPMEAGSIEFMGVKGESEQMNLMNLVFPLLIIIIMSWQRFQAKRVMTGLCPRGRMSCVGKFKRNVLSLESTYLLVVAICCCRAAGMLLASYASKLSPKAHFWVWNSTDTVWEEGCWLLLPWFLTPPQSSSSSAPPSCFYVRKPALQPRPENGISWDLVTESNVIHVKECYKYKFHTLK